MPLKCVTGYCPLLSTSCCVFCCDDFVLIDFVIVMMNLDDCFAEWRMDNYWCLIEGDQKNGGAERRDEDDERLKVGEDEVVCCRARLKVMMCEWLKRIVKNG